MMYPDPNQNQQSSYGQPQYARLPYGQQALQPPYGQPQFGQPAFGQPFYGQAQLQYVGVGRRFLALLIDGLVFSVVSIPLSLVFVNSSVTGNVNASALVAVDLLLVILIFGYYIVMEAMWGATLGKMALGLRILKVDGSPIGWKESIIRNLLRIVDGLFGYLVAAILIWSSPLRQRLGDRAASTVVVRSRT